ncbi:MAG: hypothetical protein LCH41_04410 [Armatimonadetes bacterium]|nr:hypothetical protein [Armatimonadota bacterium]
MKTCYPNLDTEAHGYLESFSRGTYQLSILNGHACGGYTSIKLIDCLGFFMEVGVTNGILTSFDCIPMKFPPSWAKGTLVDRCLLCDPVLLQVSSAMSLNGGWTIDRQIAFQHADVATNDERILLGCLEIRFSGESISSIVIDPSVCEVQGRRA